MLEVPRLGKSEIDLISPARNDRIDNFCDAQMIETCSNRDFSPAFNWEIFNSEQKAASSKLAELDSHFNHRTDEKPALQSLIAVNGSLVSTKPSTLREQFDLVAEERRNSNLSCASIDVV